MSHPQLLTPERHLVAAKRGLGLPVIVAICGSTRFMEAMTEADLQETAAGRIVVRPGCDMKQPHTLWGDPANAEDLKYRLDELHRAKIRLADEVLIVGDYIGDSTRSEIDYARALGKPIRFTHPEIDPYGTALPPVACRIRVVGSNGDFAVVGVEPVPGLRVFELPEDLREEGDGAANPWRLTHHSGLGLAAFPSREDALRGAREVADLTDWTRTPQELRADADLDLDLDEYIDRILHRTNGLLMPRDGKGAAL